MMETSYDVLIVGGRPAGASLACRLAAAGISVLLLEKAQFPSLPEVPSCPVLYQKALALLEEIGFSEDKFAHAITKVRAGIIEFEPYFRTRMQVPMVQGRDYLVGFERAAFDAAFWEHLNGIPLLSRRAGFHVTELLMDGDRVVGVEGGEPGKAKEQFRARLCVVGADGRHSFVARKVKAAVKEEQAEHTSTVHFASWEGLSPHPMDAEPVVQVVTGGRGTNVLFFPSANGHVSVTTHVRSDRADTGGDAQAYYLRTINSFAAARQRLEGGKQVGPLLGIKKIGNRTLQAGGPGWILVGDAVHHKDPVDGQGFYDALVVTKRLAALLVDLHQGTIGWEPFLSAYETAIREETHGMFKATMQRLDRELYQEPPAMVIRTAMRWMLQDPAYHQRFFYFLARDIAPETWLDAGLVGGALMRGIGRDIRSLFSS